MIVSDVGVLEMDRLAAEGVLNGLLVGACLDSFNVSNISVTLRFISSAVIPGRSVYVDCAFSCEAFIADAGVGDHKAGSGNFFTERAVFIARIFCCIGKAVDSIGLEEDGRLCLSIGDEVVVLCVSIEDDGQDESAWGVVVEESAGYLRPETYSLACVLSDSGVSFVAEVDRPDFRRHS